MNNDDGLLQSRIAWDWEQLDWPWVTRQPVGNGTYRLPRPYTSKWVAKAMSIACVLFVAASRHPWGVGSRESTPE